MLEYISVKNFAIIENIEVEFKEGMTALTGETGAGKSLLIDAIGLLLGDRATSNIVRTGSDKAIVEGIFKFNNKQITKLLKSYDLGDTNELIIKRQITPTNNNLIRINNKPVTLSQLREVTSLLADIHTQFDTHRLINQDTYIDLIDGFQSDEIEKLKQQYQHDLNDYLKELKELRQMIKSNDSIFERLDLIRFQKDEIEAFNLDVNEEEILTKEVKQMENFDKIYNSLEQAKTTMNNGLLDELYNANKQLESVSELDDTYHELSKRVNEAYYELADVLETIEDEVSKLDFDPRILDQHQERLNELDKLKRKYRKTIPEIMEYLTTITKEIDNIDNYDELIEDKQNIVEEKFTMLLASTKLLSDFRKKTALFIETELINILDSLELKKTKFSIVFTNDIPTNYMDSSVFLSHGIDEVDFLISTNVGEPQKSLSKTASGGEMSRIMLALKNLLVESLQLSLIIFDEIDSGVSGYVANQVAKRMKEIAHKSQVICITHIPQVAALSDHHLHISKEVSNDRTKAKIKVLHNEERVHEIASMISGDNITESALSSAAELLK